MEIVVEEAESDESTADLDFVDFSQTDDEATNLEPGTILPEQIDKLKAMKKLPRLSHKNYSSPNC